MRISEIHSSLRSTLVNLLMLGTIALSGTFSYSAAPPPPTASAPTVQDIEVALRHYQGTQIPFDQLKSLREWAALHPDEPIYVPITWLRASQNRISFERIRTKAIELFKKLDLTWKGSGLQSPLPFDKNRSLIPAKKAIPVVLLPDGLAIVDGHHETAAALLVGSTTIPVYFYPDKSGTPAAPTAPNAKPIPVKGMDLSQLKSNKDAWDILVKLHLAYLKNMDGTYSTEPNSLDKLENDPNRLLMSLVAKRIKIAQDGDQLLIKFADSPQDVWVRFDDGVPFIEFEGADILYANKIVYDSAWGNQVPLDVVKNMRKIFLDEKTKGNRVLSQIAVISEDPPPGHSGEDPNAHFAGFIGHTIYTKKNGTKIKDTDGAKNPVWISLDPDFINDQVAVAAAFYRAGVLFPWSDQKNISDSMIEKARAVLVDQKKLNPDSLKNIAVVRQNVAAKDIDMDDLLSKLNSHAQICNKLLCI